MKTELKLGQIITEPQQRDAIHIAVAPMQSTQIIYPGQHVCLDNGLAILGDISKAVGVVDPFLKHAVMPGQQFWLFLYPQTVTGMRHEWTHPAFADNKAAATVPNKPGTLADRMWLEEFAQEYGLTYEYLIQAARAWELTGQHHTFHGTSGQYVPDEFWDHYEAVAGYKSSNRGNFFTCSC